MPCTRYTGPVNGVARSGVTAVALPTIVFEGQLSILALLTGQTWEELFGSSAIESGSATIADRTLACPSPGEVTSDITLGCLPGVVWPLPVSASVSLGVKGSELQPVAWKGAVAVAVALCAEVKDPLALSGEQLVGLTVKF